ASLDYPGIWFGTNATSPSGSNSQFVYITNINQIALNATAGALLRVNNVNTPNGLAVTANGVGVNTVNDGTNTTAQLEVQSGATTRVGLNVFGLANTTADLATFALIADDTNTVANQITYGVNSNGTAATGFGGSFTFNLESSTTNDQTAAAMQWK